MEKIRRIFKLPEKKENVFLVIGIITMVTLGFLFFLPIVEFQDYDYEIVNTFLESDLTEKTIDECMAELGQPLYMGENIACFSGGCTCRIGYVCERKEYDFIVLFDEERCITEVYHPCKLILRSGASSLLGLIF